MNKVMAWAAIVAFSVEPLLIPFLIGHTYHRTGGVYTWGLWTEKVLDLGIVMGLAAVVLGWW